MKLYTTLCRWPASRWGVPSFSKWDPPSSASRPCGTDSVDRRASNVPQMLSRSTVVGLVRQLLQPSLRSRPRNTSLLPARRHSVSASATHYYDKCDVTGWKLNLKFLFPLILNLIFTLRKETSYRLAGRFYGFNIRPVCQARQFVDSWVVA